MWFAGIDWADTHHDVVRLSAGRGPRTCRWRTAPRDSGSWSPSRSD